MGKKYFKGKVLKKKRFISIFMIVAVWLASFMSLPVSQARSEDVGDTGDDDVYVSVGGQKIHKGESLLLSWIDEDNKGSISLSRDGTQVDFHEAKITTLEPDTNSGIYIHASGRIYFHIYGSCSIDLSNIESSPEDYSGKCITGILAENANMGFSFSGISSLTFNMGAYHGSNITSRGIYVNEYEQFGGPLFINGAELTSEDGVWMG